MVLPVLLSRVLGGITAELETGDVCSLAIWSNVLRGVDGGSERDLAMTTRISRRLAIAAVTGCVRRGWVTAAKGSRGRDVSLTDAGRHSCEVWQGRLSSYEEPRALRSALEKLVSQFALELPWYPASYGTADPSVVGGMWAGGDPVNGIPPHGQDWKPVLRGAGDTVSDVPLTALLSQALLMFAIDYEAHPMWPLSHTTLIVQHVPTDPWPLDELAFEHDITGNGKSILERHGVAVVTTQAKRKLVALTPYGQQVREHHEPYLADTEAQWRERYGDTAVDDLRAALGASPYASDESLPAHVVAPLHRG